MTLLQDLHPFSIRSLFTLVLLLISTAVSSAQDDLFETLSARGPYPVGSTSLRWMDEARGNRFIRSVAWYPASQAGRGTPVAEREATFPLIVVVHGFPGDPTDLNIINTHLASHGFVVIGVTHIDRLDRVYVDRALDIAYLLYALDGLPGDEPLAGRIDFENVGIYGWSMGGFTTLQMGGARIDWPTAQGALCEMQPQAARERCNAPDNAEAVEDMILEFGARDDGLLLLPTEGRVKAAATVATCCPRLFGERGLAAATVPLLMIHGTNDESLADYETEALFAFQHYGAQDKTLVTLVGADHMFPLTDDARVKALLTAYFGLHLQDHAEYAELLAEDAVSALDNTVFGVYDE